MSIYLKQNYPYTRTELSSVTDIKQSPYDNDIIDYSMVIGFGNEERANVCNESYKDFKQVCLTLAKAEPIIDPKTNTQNKDWQWGMIPVHFKPGAKTNANAYNRKVLNLDFDEMKDKTWADIALLLSPYQYFAWTTFNDGMPGKGRRYRISMMLEDNFPTNSDWDIYQNSIVQWMKSNGFQLDKNGSVTYCQLAILPAINDVIGTITFHWNDGVNTKKLSVINDIPFVDASTKAVKAPTSHDNNSLDADTPDDDSEQVEPAELTPIELQFIQRCKLDKTLVQEVINLLLSYDWLTKSSYSTGFDANGDEEVRFTLCNMCSALQLIGIDKKQWRQVYKHMTSKLGRTTETEKHVWDTQIDRPGRLLIAITHDHIMKLHHKQHFGLEKAPINYTEYRQERIDAEFVEDSQEIDWLKPIDLSSDKRVTVLIGDTGIGKTSAVKNITLANARIAVPTQIIKQQQCDNQIQTYDSAHRIEFIDDSLPEWFVLDEVHNLPTMGFRAEALIKSYDNIKDIASQYAKVILLSATLDAAMAQMIAAINSDIIDVSDIEVIKRTKLNGPIKTYQVVERNCDAWNYNHILMQMIMGQVNAGRLVYVVNDNGKTNDAVAAALDSKGVNTMCVSRENINKVLELPTNKRDALTDFIESDKFTMASHNLNCIITTRIGCEGVNVCDVVDSVSVIVVGDLDPTYIRQSSGRFRNAKSIDVMHLQQNIRKNPDIAGWINKRKLEIATRKTSVQYWCANNIKPSYADWVKFAGNGIKLESDWQKAFVEDGIWFDKTTNSVREVPEIAEITMKAAVDKAKFYADPHCQEIYMSEAGFQIIDGLVVDFVDDEYIAAIGDAQDEVKAFAKQSEADKRVKYKDILDKYISMHLDIKPHHYKNLSKQLGMDDSVMMAIDNMVSDVTDKVSWIIDAAVYGWTSSEVKWKYVSESSEVVKAVSAQYPVGTWFAPADLGKVAEFVLKSQIDRMAKFGYTDIATRLSATTSIWYDKLAKIDVNTGSVTSPKGWNNWLTKNGFVNLEKSSKRIGGGKKSDGYVIV